MPDVAAGFLPAVLGVGWSAGRKTCTYGGMHGMRSAPGVPAVAAGFLPAVLGVPDVAAGFLPAVLGRQT